MAKCYSEVLVDWDGTGNYNGTYDDLTSDVRNMSLQHTRQPATEYMNGAVLNIKVNNDDNKYSPPYSSSPLSGNLISGKTIVSRIWYPYDGFVDSTGTTLASHAVPYDDNFSWTNSTTGKFQCHADGYAHLSSSATSLGFVESGITDLEIAATITSPSSSPDADYDFGVVFRYVDANNYLLARMQMSTNTVRIDKVISGSQSNVGSAGFTWAASTKKTLMIRLHGSTARIFVDDEKLGTVDISAATATAAGTKIGIIAYEDSTVTKFHQFGGMRPLFKGKLKEIRPRPAKGMQYCYLKGYDTFEDFKLIEGFQYMGGTLTGDRTAGATATPFRRILYLGGQTDNHIEEASASSYQVCMLNPYSIQFLEGENLLEALYITQDTEEGFIYVDGHGYFHFEGRFHRQTAPHVEEVATFADSYDGTNAGYHQFAYDNGIDGVFNLFEVRYIQAGDASTSYNTAWSGGSMTTESTAAFVEQSAKSGGVPIKAGERIEIVGESKYNTDDAYSQVMRIPGNAQSHTSLTSSDPIQIWTGITSDAGSGTQLALTVDYEAGSTSIASGKYGGKWQLVRVRNDSASDGYLTRMFLAQSLTLTARHRQMTHSTDSDSVTTYGERKRTLKSWFSYYGVPSSQSTGTGAAGMAERKLAKYKDPIVRMRIDMIGYDKPTLMQMVHRRLSDKVGITETGMGLDQSVFIDGYHYKFSSGATLAEATFYVATTGAAFGVPGLWNTGKWNQFSWS